jgi:hypothetical protein
LRNKNTKAAEGYILPHKNDTTPIEIFGVFALEDGTDRLCWLVGKKLTLSRCIITHKMAVLILLDVTQHYFRNKIAVVPPIISRNSTLK